MALLKWKNKTPHENASKIRRIISADDRRWTVISGRPS
jgi:type IV secretory pathway VirJ component